MEAGKTDMQGGHSAEGWNEVEYPLGSVRQSFQTTAKECLQEEGGGDRGGNENDQQNL